MYNPKLFFHEIQNKKEIENVQQVSRGKKGNEMGIL